MCLRIFAFLGVQLRLHLLLLHLSLLHLSAPGASATGGVEENFAGDVCGGLTRVWRGGRLPQGNLSVVYDELGNKYDIPVRQGVEG